MDALARHLDQIATVWTSPDGAPARLVWNRRRFLVCGKPLAWFAPEGPTSGEDGPTGSREETRMWQVQARAVDNGELLIFDLAAGRGPEWTVAHIFD